ncbi:MAG: hypothetical protein AAF602_20335 [Myxococcota bacterium]
MEEVIPMGGGLDADWVGVTVALPDETVHRLGLGAMVGRGRNADLQLPDPHISVAHAGVALRAGQIWLLRYRGRLWVDGAERNDLALRKNMRIELAPGVRLRVLAVHPPTEVTTLSIRGIERTVPPMAWHLDEAGELRAGVVAGRPEIWEAEGVWYGRGGDRMVRQLIEGEAITLDGHDVILNVRTAAEASLPATLQELPPVSIFAHSDETVICVQGRAPVALRRVSHDVVRTLGRLTAASQAAVHRDDVCKIVWSAQEDRWGTLWPQKRKRLLDELGKANLPTWLIRSSPPLVQLVLREGDSFHDLDPL